MRALICTIGAALLLAGCGGGVEGTYVGGDDSFMKSMTFKGEGKVDIVLINGIGGEGTYEVDGDKVRVSANGNTNELTIDDDCLSTEGTYSTIGDQVVITIQGQPETFTLSGDTLTGELDGDRLTLRRK